MVRTLSLTAVLSLALVLAGCKEDHESLAKKAVAKLNELGSVLESVKDEASSKAAATKVKSITEDMKEIKKKADALPKLSAEEDKKLEEAHKKEMESAMEKMMKETIRISMNPSLMTPELKAALEGMSSLK